MKPLVLTSSPRENGYTAALVREVFPDAEIIPLYGADIADCSACRICGANGKCIHDDQMTALYRKLAEASLIVIATPVWFGSFPAPLKRFTDRLNFFYHNKIEPADRKLICLCTMGSRDERDIEGVRRLAKICANMLSAQFAGIFTVSGTDGIDENAPQYAFSETVEKIKKALYES